MIPARYYFPDTSSQEEINERYMKNKKKGKGAEKDLAKEASKKARRDKVRTFCSAVASQT